MMFGLMRVRTHDAEMAKAAEKLAARQRERDEANAALSEADKHIADLEARLDALTPARREDGRFVAKAQRLQPASPPPSTTGYGLEDFA